MALVFWLRVPIYALEAFLDSECLQLFWDCQLNLTNTFNTPDFRWFQLRFKIFICLCMKWFNFALLQITKLLCRRLSSGSEGEEHELEVVFQILKIFFNLSINNSEKCYKTKIFVTKTMIKNIWCNFSVILFLIWRENVCYRFGWGEGGSGKGWTFLWNLFSPVTRRARLLKGGRTRKRKSSDMILI